jgi:hypothetical protein
MIAEANFNNKSLTTTSTQYVNQDTITIDMPSNDHRLFQWRTGEQWEKLSVPNSNREVVLHPRTVSDVCNILRHWGETNLAARITYFASDEDLENGDIPVTDESACGFLSFFGTLEAEAHVQLTCSPEGWICASWRFPDERGVSLWFLDDHRVMFAATGSDGKFLEIGASEVANGRQVQERLVEAGLFAWVSDTVNNRNFYTTTMSLDIVPNDPLLMMACLAQRHSDFAKVNVIYPQTGWNTLTPKTEEAKSTLLFTH